MPLWAVFGDVSVSEIFGLDFASHNGRGGREREREREMQTERQIERERGTIKTPCTSNGRAGPKTHGFK